MEVNEMQTTELLTCKEAITRLRCGYNTLYRLLLRGDLHAYKEGRVWRIPAEGIQKYIDDKTGLDYKSRK